MMFSPSSYSAKPGTQQSTSNIISEKSSSSANKAGSKQESYQSASTPSSNRPSMKSESFQSTDTVSDTPRKVDVKSEMFQSPKASQQSDIFQSPKAPSIPSDSLFLSPRTGSQSDTSTLATSPKGVLIEEMSPVPSPVDIRSPSLSPNSLPGVVSEMSWQTPVQGDKSPIEISSDNSQVNSVDENLLIKSPDRLTMDIQTHIPYDAFQ